LPRRIIVHIAASALVLALTLISCAGETTIRDTGPRTDTGTGPRDTRPKDTANAGDTSHACADLVACCATIVTIYKVSCDSLVTAKDDQACASAYASWKAAKVCK
jgi:hypothetical protein